MIPSGIEPATFRLVAQCLSQQRYCMSPKIVNEGTNSISLEVSLYPLPAIRSKLECE